jgi:hypothetical protein
MPKPLREGESSSLGTAARSPRRQALTGRPSASACDSAEHVSAARSTSRTLNRVSPGLRRVAPQADPGRAPAGRLAGSDDSRPTLEAALVLSKTGRPELADQFGRPFARRDLWSAEACREAAATLASAHLDARRQEARRKSATTNGFRVAPRGRAREEKPRQRSGASDLRASTGPHLSLVPASEPGHRAGQARGAAASSPGSRGRAHPGSQIPFPSGTAESLDGLFVRGPMFGRGPSGAPGPRPPDYRSRAARPSAARLHPASPCPRDVCGRSGSSLTNEATSTGSASLGACCVPGIQRSC